MIKVNNTTMTLIKVNNTPMKVVNLNGSEIYRAVTPPTVSVGSYTYNGAAQGPTVTDSPDSAYYTVTGATQTNAGTYTLTVSLNDTDKYVWDNTGDTTPKTYSYTIAKKSVVPPTVSVGSYTYNGGSQGPSITPSGDSSWYTISGTPSAVNAGSYSFTVALNDKTNCTWNDSTTTDKSYSYSIAKANQSISVSPGTVTITDASTPVSVTVSGAATSLSTSGGPHIATLTVSGSTITVSSPYEPYDQETITVTAAADGNYNSASTTFVLRTSLPATLSMGQGYRIGTNPTAYPVYINGTTAIMSFVDCLRTQSWPGDGELSSLLDYAFSSIHSAVSDIYLPRVSNGTILAHISSGDVNVNDVLYPILVAAASRNSSSKTWLGTTAEYFSAYAVKGDGSFESTQIANSAGVDPTFVIDLTKVYIDYSYNIKLKEW